MPFSHSTWRPRQSESNVLIVVNYSASFTKHTIEISFIIMISFIKFFNRIYFPLLDIFSNKAFRLGPIWSGCMSHRWVFRASLVLNFSSHTLQRKGALTTSWTDLSLVLPAPAHTVLLISSRHSVTWHTRDQWHVGKREKCLKEESLMSIYVSLNTKEFKKIIKLYTPKNEM